VNPAAGGKGRGERSRPFASPDLTLALALCIVALILEAVAFLGSDPWIGSDLVGAGFLLVFVADVIVEPETIGTRTIQRLSAGWGRALVALVIGIVLLLVRPSPMPPPVVQGLAVVGAAFSVFEGLLKAGTRGP
jgi:hypothetical protein